MFDPNPNQSSGVMPNQPQKQSAPPGNLPGPRPPQVEDMFSETETPSASRISRPIQPGQAAQMPMGGDIYGGRSIMDNKILLVLLSVVGLLIVGGGIWGAVYYFSSNRNVAPANTNNNLNYDVNTNTTVDTNVNTDINTNEGINTNADLNLNENTNTVNTNTNVSLGIDSDNDGLSDEEEKQTGTNPNNFDTDGDGLVDRVEVKIYHSDPLKKDTDGDGYNDGEEVINGYDPIKVGNARLFDVPQ